ncbi:MAG TPA: hypothetical protein VFF82_05110 [Rhodocyclaceae bacterium]|nr:hypothetical protein [Rhodocyclaceae bacterium]
MDIVADLLAERPHLFSPATVEVSRRDTLRMAELIAAVERVVVLPDYQERVLGWAPGIALHAAPNRGVFFGYDFHLTPDGPKLIEINTNAGGALLAAHHAGRNDVEEAFVAMFRTESEAPLRTMAIVDESPESQYLYPEFLLFKALLARHGITAVICDPADLMLCHGGLWHEEARLDLVYNRLTDFALAAPVNTALRQAYLDGSVVVTPHPRAHALYADKRNLVVLSDDALLAAWGVDAGARRILAEVVPSTELVSPDRAEEFWSRRKELFFKPATGYGSKAAYRGDKMTKRVFEDVLAGNYVAQLLVPPSTVEVEVDGKMTDLKVDLRCYAYDGAIQLVAARLWQGQTTNFRTPGGGFAKVVAV